MSVNSFSNGTTSEIPGNMDVEMMIAATAFLNRNLSRARAYAAEMPMSRVSVVAIPATTTLFNSARPNLTFLASSQASIVSVSTDCFLLPINTNGRSNMRNASSTRNNTATTSTGRTSGNVMDQN